MQSTIEWLWEQIDGIIPYQDINTSQLFIGLLEQAKEMEKQQMFDYIKKNYVNGEHSLKFHKEEFEQYYNETYVSKGSDVMTPENHIGVLSEAVKKETTSSKTEISDEEIEKGAKEYYEENIDNSNIPREHYEWEIQELMVGFCAKWYREQLKQKRL